MTESHTRIAADYNHTLAPPVRWLHAAGALVRDFFSPITDWATSPARRLWAPALLWAVVAAAVLIPLDPVLSRWAAALNPRIRGDLRRELEMLQQYGDLATLILTAALVALLDRVQRRRIADLAIAAAFSALVVFALKMLIGRPRPEFGEPLYFLGPLGSYPISESVGVRHAWEIWAGISSKLWSMPSSHTSAAVVLSVFLLTLYPRLKPFAVAMPVLVGVCRVLFTSHFPSDVAVGAFIGLATARPAIHGQWGTRLWLRLLSGPARAAR